MMDSMRTRTRSGKALVGCILAMGLMIWCLASIPVNAQVVGATLLGTITDESHGAIPKATVSIANVATGVTTTVTTNADGIFNAPNDHRLCKVSRDGARRKAVSAAVWDRGNPDPDVRRLESPAFSPRNLRVPGYQRRGVSAADP